MGCCVIGNLFVGKLTRTFCTCTLVLFQSNPGPLKQVQHYKYPTAWPIFIKPSKPSISIQRVRENKLRAKVESSKGACTLLLVMVEALVHVAQAQNTPQDFLDAHNSARSQVGVGPMTWDTTVEAYAQNYANQRISDCQLVHSGGPYGENLFWGYGLDYNATYAVNSWVSEKQYYDYATNTCATGKVCGHYTQVVCSNSIELGCARVKCNGGAIFIVCNYNPAGNVVGQRPY